MLSCLHLRRPLRLHTVRIILNLRYWCIGLTASIWLENRPPNDVPWMRCSTVSNQLCPQQRTPHTETGLRSSLCPFPSSYLGLADGQLFKTWRTGLDSARLLFPFLLSAGIRLVDQVDDRTVMNAHDVKHKIIPVCCG